MAESDQEALRDRLLDVQFVKGPAEDWECPICKQTLLDPQLLSCCGNHFCESCVERLRRRPCPLCGEAEFKALLDKGRQRQVLQVKVHCPNSGSGCEWQGELRQLISHLVGTGSGGNVGGASPGPRTVPPCRYEPVRCENDGCGELVPRINLQQHQNDECPHRKVVCQYCNNFEGKYNELWDVHWQVCPDYPMPCPNNCGIEKMRRSQVQSHCDRDCKMQVVKCPFWEVGCNIRRQRKDLTAHIKASEPHHSQLLVKKTMELQSQQDNLVKRFTEATEDMIGRLRHRDDVIQNLHKEVTQRDIELKKFISDTDARFAEMKTEFAAKLQERDRKLETLEEKLRENGDGIEQLVTALNEREDHGNMPDRLEAELEEREGKIVEAVTHKFDSKLDVRISKFAEEVDSNYNTEFAKLADEMAQVVTTTATIQTTLGMGTEENRLCKLETTIETLREEFTKLVSDKDADMEEKLEELMPRAESEENVTALKNELLAHFETQVDNKLEARFAEARETQQEEQDAERRERKAAVEKLMDEVADDKDSIKILREQVGQVRADQEDQEDKLAEEVKRVQVDLLAEVAKVMKEVEYIEVAATPTPPFSFTVSRFSKRREKKESFVSEPFYTSHRGYRMVVRVDSAGTESHVSVWCCITRGQHDSINPWPLRADIFIRLINQKDKEKYYERQISYDHQALTKHAGRVTTGDKNYLWGLREFITMKEINNGHYLVGDALDFVVHRVDLKEMNRPLEEGE